MMMQIIMYDGWLESASKKIRVGGKEKQRMSKMQIKSLMQLCASAEKAEFLSNGVLYQIK